MRLEKQPPIDQIFRGSRQAERNEHRLVTGYAQLQHFLDVFDGPQQWRNPLQEAAISLMETLNAVSGKTTDRRTFTSEEISEKAVILENHFSQTHIPDKELNTNLFLTTHILPRLVAANGLTSSAAERVAAIELLRTRLQHAWARNGAHAERQGREQLIRSRISAQEIDRDIYGCIVDYWKEHPLHNQSAAEIANARATYQALRQTRIMPRHEQIAKQVRNSLKRND